MVVVFVLIALSLFSALNFYIGSRIFFWLQTLVPGTNQRIFWVIYILLATSTIAAQLINQATWVRPLKLFGNYWMGIFAYLLVTLFVVDMIRLLLKVTRLMPDFFSTKQGITMIGATVAVVIFGILFYGIIHASQVQTATYQVTVAKKFEAEKMKIVMASDFHLGNVISTERVEEAVRMINKEKPDLVILAGDIFDGDYNAVEDPKKVAALFKSIQSTYGTYAILGNHDAGKTFDKMVAFFDRTGIKLLQDDVVNVGNRFTLIGRRDRSPIGNRDGKRKPIDELIGDVDFSKPVILLDHQPSGIDDARKIQADMLLSGHTHRGQIYPFNYVVKMNFEVDYGFKKDGNLNTIVSSGVGTWGPPLRVGSDSEIVRIDMRFE